MENRGIIITTILHWLSVPGRSGGGGTGKWNQSVQLVKEESTVGPDPLVLVAWRETSQDAFSWWVIK